MRRVLLVAAVLLLTAAAPRDQQPVVIPGLGETIEVAIVNVDVVVTDAKGNRVRGLTKDDFEILENQKPQTITNFAEYASDQIVGEAHAGVEAAAQTAQPQEKRTVVIFLEPFRLDPVHVTPFIDGLKDFVRRTIRPGDSISVFEYRRKPVTSVPPTDDISKVFAALDAFGRLASGAYHDDGTTAADEAALDAEFDAPNAQSAENQAQMQYSRAIVNASLAKIQMNRRIAAITSLIDSLSGVNGRKMLVLSPRLSRYTGAEFFYAIGQMSLDDDVKARFDNSDRIRQIAASANAAGVTLYPLFAPGTQQVFSADIAYQVMSNEMSAFDELAERTGGMSRWGTRDIAKLLPQVADDAAQYYSLAYRVTTKHDDTTRRIAVRTKNRDLHVRARSEFVEKSDDRRMRERVVSAATGIPSHGDFAIGAVMGALKKQGRRESIPIRVGIPVASLVTVPNGDKLAGAFSVYVASGGDDGTSSDVVRQTQKFEIPRDKLSKLASTNFTYDLELVVNAKASHVAVAVIDEVSKAYGVVEGAIRR